MAGRAIWKGYINFGDANMPVKLHTAISEERIQFHLLHKSDHVQVRQQMVCIVEKKPVPAAEQTKGFKMDEDKYIIVDPAELEKAVPEENRIIEVHEFVKNDDIDPMFLERAYYLEPDTDSKGYGSLVAVLEELDVSGICTWTMRKRSYFGALQAGGRVLRLNTLRYADEVIPAKSLELEKIAVSEKELKIAGDLIEHLTAAFQPEKFEDEHQKKLRDLIDKKARGEKIAIVRPRRLKATEPDKLLQALEASLKKVA